MRCIYWSKLDTRCTKDWSYLTAAWLAQLVERRTAVREVVGSNPRPDQHSES